MESFLSHNGVILSYCPSLYTVQREEMAYPVVKCKDSLNVFFGQFAHSLVIPELFIPESLILESFLSHSRVIIESYCLTVPIYILCREKKWLTLS